jgi:DNA-binding response OmpR family regulator
LSAVRSKRVLVADRDEIVLVLTRHVLTREGYAVDVATDAAMLDDLLRLNDYGSILVDVNLVGKEWLHALPPGTSDCVIAIVSEDHDSLPVKAVIRKPLELDRLAEVVSRCGQSKTGSSNDAA